MMRLIRKTMPVLMLMLMVYSAKAFSLMGPFAAWQVSLLGYNSLGTDMGGPMNLGEEYRWNTKTIVYGFDPSFRDYFGERGVSEVRKAIAILNALPPMSKLSSNLTEFPLDTKRVNYQAAGLRLIDLKSAALAMLMNQLGLASPERYVWTLRDDYDVPGSQPPIKEFSVIKRNFDPATLTPSSYVNGTLYTYTIFGFGGPPPTWYDAVELQVNANDFIFKSVASAAFPAFTGPGSFNFGLELGEYFSGLTRDDVGGLRYIYSSKALPNVESLPANTTGFSGIPWTPGGSGGGANFVNQALRPGIDKLTFVETRYDSGTVILGMTNRYADYYITNSTIQKQMVQRILTQPDILFEARDIGPYGTAPIPIPLAETVAANWINNDAINGTTPLFGPGVIPTSTISFTTAVPYIYNTQGDLLSETEFINLGFAWGSFDETTNAPVVYPNVYSIDQLQQDILGN